MDGVRYNDENAEEGFAPAAGHTYKSQLPLDAPGAFCSSSQSSPEGVPELDQFHECVEAEAAAALRVQDCFTCATIDVGRPNGSPDLPVQALSALPPALTAAISDSSSKGEIAAVAEDGEGEVMAAGDGNDERNAAEGGDLNDAGGGRRRRRRISLGLAAAGSGGGAGANPNGKASAEAVDDDAPRFSARELRVRIEAVEAAAAAATERALQDAAKRHEAETLATRAAVTSAEEEAVAAAAARTAAAAARADAAEKRAAELEQKLASLAEGEAAKATQAGTAVAEKSAQLEAMTQQYLTLKRRSEEAEAAWSVERADLVRAVAAGQKSVSESEDRVAELKAELAALAESEKEKRTAAVLKMKNDMKTLAEKQFAEANKHYRALQLSLHKAEAAVRETGKRAAVQKAEASSLSKEAASLRSEVEGLQRTIAARDAALAAAAAKQQREAAAAAAAIEAANLSAGEAQSAMESADSDRDAAQDSLARLTVRHNNEKVRATALEARVKELETISNSLYDMVQATPADPDTSVGAAAASTTEAL